MRFKVERPADGQGAYVTDEGGHVRIGLEEPADFQHAWRVAEFLSGNVHAIEAEVIRLHPAVDSLEAGTPLDRR